MPKVKRQYVTRVPAANGNGGGLHVSNQGLAAIAAALAALAIVWAGVRNVATVSDLSVRDAEINTLQVQEKSLEVNFARFFGKSAPTPSAEPEPQPAHDPSFLMAAQYVTAGTPQISANAQASKLPQRRVVVPSWYINQFHLEPWHGGSYAVLGEDGAFYALDDIIATLIAAHEGEIRGPNFSEPQRRKK